LIYAVLSIVATLAATFKDFFYKESHVPGFPELRIKYLLSLQPRFESQAKTHRVASWQRLPSRPHIYPAAYLSAQTFAALKGDDDEFCSGHDIAL
jgi:hypothetical protein